ncbi:POK8 protein, partial [Tricholaema leucomelas]|nr:POK8 protein [Tricholaema leucomelas]
IGALQPGLPSHSMIPENWELLVIDLKDCFFTILWPAPLNQFTLAREAHATFHQNAKGLKCQFQISNDNAKEIVHSCPVCSH